MDAPHDSSIRPLTSLRFLAALLVFLSHYGGYVYSRAEQPWQSILIEGHAGVTVFFVLSGFLITLRYLPAIHERQFTFRQYFVRRAARILPLYWFILALTLLLTPLTGFQLYMPVPIVNWTLTQGYFNDLSQSFLIAAWSLSIEESFYLIAPVILYFCAVFKQETRAVFLTLTAWVIGLLAAGSALVWIAQSAGLNHAYGFMNDYGFMLFFTIFGRGFTFCLGIFMAWLYLKYRNTLWKHPHAAQNALLLFGLSGLGIGIAEIGMNAAGGIINGWPFNQVIAFFSAWMILALTCPTGWLSRLLSQRLPVYLGHISYALYLLQTTTMARGLFLNLLPSLGLLTTPVFYVVLSVCGAALYQVVERPARRFIIRAGSYLTGGAFRLTWT
jgi:peptidoglycan/LPS O-acetylase OafA/YrhL